MAPAVGIEPTVSPLSVNELGGTLSPHSSPDLGLLLKVVEGWPRINGSLKLAILATVDAAAGKEVAP